MERFRERSSDISKEQAWSYTNVKFPAACEDADPVILSDNSGSYVPETRYESMNDVVTPTFKELSGKGQIINNPMSKQKVDIHDHPCNYTYDYEWKLWNTACDPDKWTTYRNEARAVNCPSSDYLDMGLLPTLPSYSQTALIDRAVSSAWSSIGDESLLSLVAVAESQKTMVSMALILKRLIKIIRLIKSAQFAKLRNEISFKELEGRYMEIRYAIRPLMYDCKGIVDALTREPNSKPKRQTFRGSTTYSDGDTDYGERPLVMNTNKGIFSATCHETSKWSRDIIVRAGVLTELQESSQLNIWGLTQPIESAWELVPFSFIVDWFFNVSDVLGSWSPDYGFHTLASWYTVTMTEYQYTSRYYSDCTVESHTGDTPNYQAVAYLRDLRDCYYERTVTTVVRVPEPSRAGVPRLNVRLDAFKLTDLLIIARKLWLRDNLRGGGLRY